MTDWAFKARLKGTYAFMLDQYIKFLTPDYLGKFDRCKKIVLCENSKFSDIFNHATFRRYDKRNVP